MNRCPINEFIYLFIYFYKQAHIKQIQNCLIGLPVSHLIISVYDRSTLMNVSCPLSLSKIPTTFPSKYTVELKLLFLLWKQKPTLSSNKKKNKNISKEISFYGSTYSICNSISAKYGNFGKQLSVLICISYVGYKTKDWT